MKKILSALIAIMLLALLPACATSKPASKENLRLVLDWTPNTNHTGIYVASALGYYKEVGLSVEIIQPPEYGALSLVAGGGAEFAISFQEELAPALSSKNPLPLTAVAGIVNHNTSGVLSLKDSGITRPKDLEGKTFVSWDAPVVRAMMDYMIEADGGDFSKVNFEINNASDIVSALQSGADAVWVFYAWDGIIAETSGLDTTYFDIADFQLVFDYYSPIIVAGNDYLKNNPDEATAFLAATSKGYDYAIIHPEEAAKLLLEAVPELDYDAVLASQHFLAGEYQSDSPSWGWIDDNRWTSFYDWMYDQKMIDAPLGSSGYSNDYLPKQ